jgi:uncharacterized protein YkwD
MSASHRATRPASFLAGRAAVLRLFLAGALGIILFGGAAYGGSRMLAGDGSGSGRSAGAAPAAPAGPAGPAAAGGEAAASPTAEPSSAPASPAATPSTPVEAATKAKPTQTRTTAPASGPVNEVLRLVNVERAKAGCNALTTDSRLAAAANAHSADMAANDYFSHTGRNGSQVSDRVEAAGYRWRAVAENIAKGQPTPAAVMQAWMNSSGHRANILNCRYRNIGIGLAYDGRSPVWTQNFATPA